MKKQSKYLPKVGDWIYWRWNNKKYTPWTKSYVRVVYRDDMLELDEGLAFLNPAIVFIKEIEIKPMERKMV